MPLVEAASPLRRQYERLKARYPYDILLFRLGDFYETFGEDAKVAARELEIVLTARELGKGHRLPMAGIPAAALEGHLAKLLARGHRVAICEQLGDPRASKGLMEREVVRVVTPGTVTEPALLPGAANNYLAAAVPEGERAGLAYVDITTSEFVTLELAPAELATELRRIAPAELLVPRGVTPFWGEVGSAVTPLDPDLFDPPAARRRLLEHLGATSLEPYGCEGLPLAVAAAGAVLAYLQETQRGSLAQVQSLTTGALDRVMRLDPQTVRALELFGSAGAGRAGSLLALLDLTQTPMGGRLLRRWLGQPLQDLAELRARQDAVAWILESGVRRARLRAALGRVPDVERLVNRVRGGTAGPRDLVALRRGLEALAELRAELGEAGATAQGLGWACHGMGGHAEVAGLIARSIAEEPAPVLGEGEVVRTGFSPELDALRATQRDAREAIARMEAAERQRTGISSLKVGYTRVFGYYLEVTRPHLARVPADYVRKQTVAGAERFFTPGLKELEERISAAEERAGELEAALFRQVCRQIGEEGEALLASARAAARLDLLAAFAETAARYRYVRPVLDEGLSIEIVGGRHPVVERSVEEPFVPNDTALTPESHLAILTGPNMAGKSTYLRQVALIVLMAQVGSFVPAQSARIGLVDRVFVRAGLQDDIATGRSTFMVEMMETAYILHQATRRSLIVLDEIGRGTSTYDGLAIAWAVAEQVHNHPRLGARTLFATHYHELVELGETLPRAANYHVAVAEEDGRVVFLRRVLPGGADRSYGVHVAQLAGLPRAVVARAREVLGRLEDGPARRVTHLAGPARGQRGGRPREAAAVQPALLPTDPDQRGPSPVEEALGRLDLDGMTPLEALATLYDLKRTASDRRRDAR